MSNKNNVLIRTPKSKYPLWISKNDIFTLTYGKLPYADERWGITAYLKRFTQTPFIPVFQSSDKEDVEQTFIEFGKELEMFPVEAVTFIRDVGPRKVFVNPCVIENMKVIRIKSGWVVEIMAAAVYLTIKGGETEEEAVDVAETWARLARWRS